MLILYRFNFLSRKINWTSFVFSRYPFVGNQRHENNGSLQGTVVNYKPKQWIKNLILIVSVKLVWAHKCGIDIFSIRRARCGTPTQLLGHLLDAFHNSINSRVGLAAACERRGSATELSERNSQSPMLIDFVFSINPELKADDASSCLCIFI